MDSVIFKIYRLENEFYKDYVCNLDDKIIDIKNKILNDISDNKYNYLDFENITERIYKDYGKLFFDIGFIPSINDNYKLSQFTINNREFKFIIHPKSIEIKTNLKKTNEPSFLKKIILEDRKKNNDTYQYFEDDFPPLK
jgi:hypothetical protein